MVNECRSSRFRGKEPLVSSITIKEGELECLCTLEHDKSMNFSAQAVTADAVQSESLNYDARADR